MRTPRSLTSALRAGRLGAIPWRSCLIGITALCVFVPVVPAMPQGTLDGSWQYAMNEAVARGMVLGRDIVFTFGPLSAIYTRAYHPANFGLTVTSTVCLGALFGSAVARLARLSCWPATLLFCLVLAFLRDVPDALLLTYPLVVAMVSLEGETATQPAAANGERIRTACHFGGIGLLLLIKASFIPICVVATGVCMVQWMRHGRADLAAFGLLGAAVATPAGWVLAGQPMEALPHYFTAFVPIVAGYAEAMSLYGSKLDVTAYLIGAAVLLAAWLIPIERNRMSLGVVLAAYFFLCFKAAFVRHDEFHVFTSGAALLLASALSFLRTGPRSAFAAMAVALLFFGYLESGADAFFAERPLTRAFAPFRDAALGSTRWIADPQWARRRFDSALASLRADLPPAPAGSADIYPTEQAMLLASGRVWAPRPIFQSYSAYTPALADANRDHLTGDLAPHTVFFKVSPIDGRLPALEDGPSWPLLLSRYRPTVSDRAWVVLERTDSMDVAATGPADGIRTRVRLGATVPLDSEAAQTFAQIDVRLTPFGALLAALYKPADLRIVLFLADGSSRTWRYVAGMGKSGFLLSPLVLDTTDFRALYDSAQAPAGRRVVAFAIEQAGRMPGTWAQDYAVTMTRLPSR